MRWFKKKKEIFLGKVLEFRAKMAIHELKALKKAQVKELKTMDIEISMMMSRRRIIRDLIKKYENIMKELKEEL